MDNTQSQVTTGPKDNWIMLQDGKFTCVECGNEIEPLTNTPEGLVKADLNQIKEELKTTPTKIIYAVCSTCGMEYQFRLVGEDLYLEPSDELK